MCWACSCPLVPSPLEYLNCPRAELASSPVTPKLCDKSPWPNIFGKNAKLNVAESQEISKHVVSERTQLVLSAFRVQHWGHESSPTAGSGFSSENLGFEHLKKVWVVSKYHFREVQSVLFSMPNYWQTESQKYFRLIA